MNVGASSLLLLGLFLPGFLRTGEETRVLRGSVTDAEGRPLAGAVVFACPVAYTAGQGTACEYIQGKLERSDGYYCPTCQADRGPHVLTGADGSFEIGAPEPSRSHFLVAVMEGYRPALKGEKEDGSRPIIVLSPMPEERLQPAHVHVGRVLDPAGEPVPAASVRCVGMETEAGRRWMRADVDNMTVTGEDGLFLLTCGEPDAALHARIRAPGCATRMVLLPAGEEPTTVQLERGVTLRGRFVDEGRALAGVGVGLVPLERAPEEFLGDMRTVTDDEGRFRFDNVATGHTYHLFGRMGELADGRVVGLKHVDLRADPEPVDVGDLEPGPTHRLSGRVVVGDGEAPPEDTMLLVMRRDAWDSLPFPVRADGSFEATGLPAEPLVLSVRLPGYRLSRHNPSRDPDDRFDMFLTGLLSGDLEDFVVHLVADADAVEGEVAPPAGGHPAGLPLRSAAGLPTRGGGGF
jgi:hypothetical protein